MNWYQSSWMEKDYSFWVGRPLQSRCGLCGYLSALRSRHSVIPFPLSNIIGVVGSQAWLDEQWERHRCMFTRKPW